VSQLSLSLGCAAPSLRNQELFWGDEKLKTRDQAWQSVKGFQAPAELARCAIQNSRDVEIARCRFVQG
jgi:hypothetical protein